MVRTNLGSEGLCLYCSSSVNNFREKLDKKFKLPDWSYFKLFKPTLFFGMYHFGDYKRFILHRGKKYIIWAGSDILNLNKWNNWIFKLFKARHYCENEIEYRKLLHNGIVATIKPLFLGSVDDFLISYQHLDRPEVWLCMHPGREEEYGLDIIFEIAKSCPEITFNIYGLPYQTIPKKYTKVQREQQFSSQGCNIVNHGVIPEQQFNEEIKSYQCGLRLNEFDGFSEVVAKSILLGQYPISRIKYDYIDTFSTLEDLIKLLKQLKYKKKPNIEARNYWYNQLKGGVR